jgi:hypothetical protein
MADKMSGDKIIVAEMTVYKMTIENKHYTKWQ